MKPESSHAKSAVILRLSNITRLVKGEDLFLSLPGSVTFGLRCRAP